MTQIGYALSSEEHGPNDLVEYARGAEEAGFDFAVISDHYHPWTTDQGESPFVWGTLGAIAEATDELRVGMSVTCPTIRIHPAIIAQAAATAAVQFDGRFFFGVGTGENLNEHVLGDRWPPHRVRLDMLEEAIGLIRELWDGEMTSQSGDHYTVENARISTLPDDLPPVHVSGLGPKAATAAGRFGDGFICTSPDPDLVERYEAGGDGPIYGGTKVCWAESDDEARETAYDWWPNAALEGVGTELPTPQHFEEALEMVSEADVAESIVTGPDSEPYIEHIEEFLEAGFDTVYFHQIGPDQEGVFEFCEEELLPVFS